MEDEDRGNLGDVAFSDSHGDGEASAAAMTKLLGTMPDCAWENVASDCYNIALASRRFFQPVSCSPVPQQRGDQEPRRKSKRQKTAGSPPLLLATRMLRVSLEHNLERVLKHSRSGITLESLKKLGELPEDSAVIAGSTMVQACLGVLWGKEGKKTYNDGRSDVDIFCSAKAAPAVRSWLVENSDCMFVGLRDSYVSLASSKLLYSVDTNIHHVEHWGSISENASYDGHYSGGSPPADIDAKNTEYYKEVVGYGKQCQSRYIEWKFQNGLHFDVLGIDQNKAYDVKTENGVDLPFDFAGKGNIDLVVGRLKDKSGNTKLTPGDLLSDFDLEICKCSFDGRKFRVADPHNTFSGRTTMEPNRRAVVGSYARHFAPPASRYIRDEAASAHAGAVIARVRADVRDAPFYEQLDRAASLRGHYSPDDLWDSETQLKFGASIQFHNFVVKLINRLKKYQVIDAPEIAEDKEFFSYSFGF